MKWLGFAASVVRRALLGMANPAFVATEQPTRSIGPATDTKPRSSANGARLSRLTWEFDRLKSEIARKRGQHRATYSLRRRLREIRSEMLRLEIEDRRG